jgi:hypothetical protein
MPAQTKATPDLKPPDGPATYVQVVPIYLASDTATVAYFRDHADEVDAITGPDVVVLLTDEVTGGDAKAVAEVIRSESSAGGKFPGLKFQDLPCLWVADDRGGRAIINLPSEPAKIGEYVRAMADVCRQTKDAHEIKARVLKAVIKEGEPDVSKSTERLIALVCGVAFIALLLVIAIFIPNPSSFQYTIFRIVLSLAAAGFVSMTPGFITAQVGNWVRGGGALAVFVVVYFFSPAAVQAIQSATH